MSRFKKVGVIVVILVAFVIVVICCIVVENRNKLILSNYECDGGYSNVSSQYLDSAISKNFSYLLIEWSNNTEETIIYGEDFHLYKEVEGKWKECPYVNDWLSIGYEIKPGVKVTRKFPLNIFGVLDEGNYRIKQEYEFAESDERFCLEVYFQLETAKDMCNLKHVMCH